MKSLLHEGSSIIKAIEAAWASAGMPEEFSIKVLEAGEKNFFGMTKRPAVVSIIFDPMRQAKKSGQDRRVGQRNEQKNEKITRLDLDAAKQQHEQSQERRRPEHRERQEKQAPQQQKQRQDRQQGQQRPGSEPRPERQQEKNRHEKKPEIKEVQEQQRPAQEPQVQEPAVWSADMAQEIMTLMTDILKIMDSPVTAAQEIQGQQLVIKLSAPILADAEQERNLYASLAFLMLQIIKKTHKKRFKGYRILFQHAA